MVLVRSIWLIHFHLCFAVLECTLWIATEVSDSKKLHTEKKSKASTALLKCQPPLSSFLLIVATVQEVRLLAEVRTNVKGSFPSCPFNPVLFLQLPSHSSWRSPLSVRATHIDMALWIRNVVINSDVRLLYIDAPWCHHPLADCNTFWGTPVVRVNWFLPP